MPARLQSIHHVNLWDTWRAEFYYRGVVRQALCISAAVAHFGGTVSVEITETECNVVTGINQWDFTPLSQNYTNSSRWKYGTCKLHCQDEYDEREWAESGGVLIGVLQLRGMQGGRGDWSLAPWLQWVWIIGTQCIQKVCGALHLFHMLSCWILMLKSLKYTVYFSLIEEIPHKDKVKNG